MKILTMPERMVLLSLYQKEQMLLSEVVEETQISTIDCFNILQRLLIKDLVQYQAQQYFIPKHSLPEIKNLLQQKELKNLEIEQIVKSSLEAETSKLKMQEVQCSPYDLKILRHYFAEIERHIEQIKVRKDKTQDQYFFFWGEQPKTQYMNHLKKQYSI